MSTLPASCLSLSSGVSETPPASPASLAPPASPACSVDTTPSVRTMVGVDVGKKTLVCCVSDDKTRDPLDRRTFPNSVAGIEELLEWLPARAPLVIEPTGRYSQLAVRTAVAAGRVVLLAPPRESHLFNKSLNIRAKTDKIDSYGLALFGLSRNLRPFPTMTDNQERVNQLLRARRGLSQMVARMTQQCQELPEARPALKVVIEQTKTSIKQLDAQVKQLVSATPELRCARELLRVHGIGPVSAAALATCLGSRNFENSDQFVAFVGLDVRVIQSGKRSGTMGLTKHGDAELRRLLYLCAMASLRSPASPFRAQYERELAKGTMKRTGALCAVARKIARVAWALMKRGAVYNPERVHQAPPKPPTVPNTPADSTDLAHDAPDAPPHPRRDVTASVAPTTTKEGSIDQTTTTTT